MANNTDPEYTDDLDDMDSIQALAELRLLFRNLPRCQYLLDIIQSRMIPPKTASVLIHGGPEENIVEARAPEHGSTEECDLSIVMAAALRLYPKVVEVLEDLEKEEGVNLLDEMHRIGNNKESDLN